MKIPADDPFYQDELFRQYWNKYRRLVMATISKLARPDEDLEQVGRIALWLAMVHYREERGAPFDKFLYYVVWHYARDWIRSSGYFADRILCTVPLPGDGDHDGYDPLQRQTDLALSTEEQGYAEVESRLFMEQLMQHLSSLLSPSQLRCITLHFGLAGEPLTMEQVAGQLGISRQRVHQIIQSAIKTIRAVLPGYLN